MRRKTILWTVTILAVLGGVLTALFLLLRHEPGFYRSKEIPAGQLRTEQGKQFTREFSHFINETLLNEGDNWQVTFTESQINSYFQEQFITSGIADAMPVKRISAPRIAIDGDIIRLGFRFGEAPWSTVVSVDLKVWQAKSEQNVVAVQLLGVRAGMIPLSSKLLMDQLTALVQSQNKDIEVNWYRHDSYLVALLRFGASRPIQSNQLDTLEVRNGKIVIAGHSRNAIPHHDEAPAMKK